MGVRTLRLLALIFIMSAFIKCSSTLEYYTMEPKLPSYLQNKEIVSIDTVNSYSGKSYVYKLRKAK